ncbi:unnamed protein product [Mytilus coruscus]|uniref:Uncharacterized protein n=1 Tax=Mytilus coruscus TaxID=42192 RepID=A0A6J8DDD5_MYTCO|nr:unnamed protein product [Mytilus coruscus]
MNKTLKTSSEINNYSNTCVCRHVAKPEGCLNKGTFYSRFKTDIKRFVKLSNRLTFEEAFRSTKREECNNIFTNRDKQAVTCALCSNNLKDNIKDLNEQMKVLTMKMNDFSTRGRGSFGNPSNRFQQWGGQGRGSNGKLRTTESRPIWRKRFDKGMPLSKCDVTQLESMNGKDLVESVNEIENAFNIDEG